MSDVKQLVADIEVSLAQHKKRAEVLMELAGLMAVTDSASDVAKIILRSTDGSWESAGKCIENLSKILQETCNALMLTTRLEYLEQGGKK